MADELVIHDGTVDFEVLDDVTISDHVVIARNSVALGAVTEAKPAAFGKRT